MAMYEAKASGKARWAKYDPAMGEATRVRLDLEADIHEALARDELAVVYQPIVDLASGRLTGFEALLRWHHPQIGAIPPEQFIPILEGNGQIIPIGNWVLEQACQTIVGWTNDVEVGVTELSIAVNVSSVQIAQSDFVAVVQRVIDESGIDPTRIVLEITETGLVDDPVAASTRLADLRAIGVRIAIDDFGTGYSSLNYLHHLPCDTLKIDRSFVHSIEPGEPMPAIVRGVLDLARTLGIEVVAEGIEDAHQVSELREGRCDKGQGFFFATPLSPDDARRWMYDRVREVTA
jgi:EAL domain-containing protein (putative c-di-GMP-specific phosphodiesterase class I)